MNTELPIWAGKAERKDDALRQYPLTLNEMIESSVHLPSVLMRNNIHRIPTPLYEEFCGLAELSGDKEVTKKSILKRAKEWALEKFPGHVIVNTVDLRIDEAQLIHPHLTWGMYVQLAPGEYADWNTISDGTPQLPDIFKAIGNG